MAIKADPGATVSGTCENFPVSRFTIMRQLNSLEDAGFISREREGKIKRLYLRAEMFDRLSAGWLRHMAEEPDRFQPER